MNSSRPIFRWLSASLAALSFAASALAAVATSPTVLAAPVQPEISSPQPFQPVKLPPSFAGRWEPVGRLKIATTSESAILQGGFVMSGLEYGDYQMSFRARATPAAGEVQIWAGLRCRDRDSQYVFALRGGVAKQLYLARYAPDGNAKYLGFAPLDFVPAVGQWYRLRAVVAGNRIQIYLGDEKLPRINVVDRDALWQTGGIALGGGWLPTEYRDFSVMPLSDADRATFNAVGEQTWEVPAPDKEAQRRQERVAYRPIAIGDFKTPRSEFSLDGNWLFMPDQELDRAEQPIEANTPDEKWHTLAVPGFWKPAMPWLHGENGFNELRGASRSKGIADELTVDELKKLNALTFDWNQTQAGWYRQYFDLPTGIAGRRFQLNFDAIAKVAEVWVNGTRVGSHTGMFGALTCDISSAVKPGRNLIAVHCVGVPNRGQAADKKIEGVAVTVEVTGEMLRSLPHGMFPGEVSGIWQPVKLIVTNPVAVEDVFMRPKLDGATFDVEVSNASKSSQSLSLGYTITAAKDGKVLFQKSRAQTVQIGAEGQTKLTLATPKLAPQLWTPSTPNLYRLNVSLSRGNQVLDRYEVPFGFRTFTVSGEKLLLNGKPYWLRGANHFPNTLRPNDVSLAHRFTQLAHDGNVRVTRSHTVPFTQAWLDAADEVGMGVSYEGTWPWLMLSGPPPSAELLKVWKDEFSALIRKYRNHPSVLIWTVNNESKFPILEQDDRAALMQKWPILSDMIKTMRQIDPTRPIIADSAYTRAEARRGYENVVKPNGFDDGDIDDTHRYYGWYNESPFYLFDGKRFSSMATPGRPLISQEMSTGYPRDDGHPTRSYLFQHATPLALVGKDAYENADPAIFMGRQAFMTKELAEVLRRANRKEAAGVLHFAYLTWFDSVWKSQSLRPKATYYALKTALQPVLVSAELYGRHFFAGDTITRRVCIVNDAESGRELPPSQLLWQLKDGDKVLAQGTQAVGAVPYYSNLWLDTTFVLPKALPRPRVDAQLVLTLRAGNQTLSQNQYDLTLATRAWAGASVTASSATPPQVVAFDPTGRMKSTLQGHDVRFITSLDGLDPKSLLIVGNLAELVGTPAATTLTDFVNAGGRALLLQPGASLARLFPAQVKSYKKADGEMVTMHVPESPVFEGVAPLDMSWFDLGPGRVPLAASGRYQIDASRSDVTALADQCDIHGYLKRPQDFLDVSGSPLVEIRLGAGRVLASEMRLDTGSVDPIAARLLTNMIRALQTSP